MEGGGFPPYCSFDCRMAEDRTDPRSTGTIPRAVYCLERKIYIQPGLECIFPANVRLKGLEGRPMNKGMLAMMIRDVMERKTDG